MKLHFISEPQALLTATESSHMYINCTMATQVVDSRFVIENVLGRGGSSSVYAASFKGDPTKRLAIKVLRLKGKKAKDLRHLFCNEVSILRDLNHRNIVKMVLPPEEDPSSGTGFIYLEIHQKEALSGLLRCFDALDIWKICQDMSLALHYLHGRRIYHRDVKPGNILRASNGDAILTDFGMAGRLPPNSSTVDEWITTPGFAGPEIDDWEPMCPFKLDMYSLGVTLVVLLFGVYPKSGENPLEIIDYCPTVQTPLRRILFHLLHEDPQQRWSVIHLIQDCLQNGKQAVDAFHEHPSPFL